MMPEQNGHHFADNIFKCVFLKEEVCNLIEIPLKFIAMGPIDNKLLFGSENCLSPNKKQIITWTNVDRNILCDKTFGHNVKISPIPYTLTYSFYKNEIHI